MKGENTLQIILWGQQFLDTETKEKRNQTKKNQNR